MRLIAILGVAACFALGYALPRLYQSYVEDRKDARKHDRDMAKLNGTIQRRSKKKDKEGA